MRVAPQTIICWCILAMVLPLVKGTKVDLNSNMKKRFRVWLQSRMKTDFHSSSATGEVDSAIVIGSQQRETELSQLHSRSRRSTVTSVKRPGCALGTCALHDLGHRLNHYNNKLNTSAPEEKMSSKGYGRRRRRHSLPKCYARLTLQAGRLRLGWSSEPCQTGLNQAGEWRVWEVSLHLCG